MAGSLVTDEMWAEAKSKYDDETRQVGKEGRSKENYDEIFSFLSNWDSYTKQQRREVSHGNQAIWRTDYAVQNGELMKLHKPDAAAAAADKEADAPTALTLTQVSHRERFFEDIKAVHLECVLAPRLACRPFGRLCSANAPCARRAAVQHAKSRGLMAAVKGKFGISIPRTAVDRFVKFCPVCIMQRVKLSQPAGHCPIVTEGFGRRGQVLHDAPIVTAAALSSSQRLLLSPQ